MAGKYTERSIVRLAKFACLYQRSWHLVELMPAETGLAETGLAQIPEVIRAP